MNMNFSLPEQEIKKILQDYFQNDYDTTEFCYINEITEAQLQLWIEKYPDQKPAQSNGFVDIVPAQDRKPVGNKRRQAVETGTLFARIGDIELYQHVPAAYLKSLKS
jgi:hypothetical protein